MAGTSSTSTTTTEVSEAEVETRTVTAGAEGFTPVTVYNVRGDEREASSQAELYALEFDGFAQEKPVHRMERRAAAKKAAEKASKK